MAALERGRAGRLRTRPTAKNLTPVVQASPAAMAAIAIPPTTRRCQWTHWHLQHKPRGRRAQNRRRRNHWQRSSKWSSTRMLPGPGPIHLPRRRTRQRLRLKLPTLRVAMGTCFGPAAPAADVTDSHSLSAAAAAACCSLSLSLSLSHLSLTKLHDCDVVDRGSTLPTVRAALELAVKAVESATQHVARCRDEANVAKASLDKALGKQKKQGAAVEKLTADLDAATKLRTAVDGEVERLRDAHTKCAAASAEARASYDERNAVRESAQSAFDSAMAASRAAVASKFTRTAATEPVQQPPGLSTSAGVTTTTATPGGTDSTAAGESSSRLGVQLQVGPGAAAPTPTAPASALALAGNCECSRPAVVRWRSADVPEDDDVSAALPNPIAVWSMVATADQAAAIASAHNKVSAALLGDPSLTVVTSAISVQLCTCELMPTTTWTAISW